MQQCRAVRTWVKDCGDIMSILLLSLKWHLKALDQKGRLTWEPNCIKTPAIEFCRSDFRILTIFPILPAVIRTGWVGDINSSLLTSDTSEIFFFSARTNWPTWVKRSIIIFQILYILLGGGEMPKSESVKIIYGQILKFNIKKPNPRWIVEVSWQMICNF